MLDEVEEKEVQAAVDTPRSRPTTHSVIDPVWELLFDRFDAQDDNIKRAVDNTVVIAGEQRKLRKHVNEEQDDYRKLLDKKVDAEALFPTIIHQALHRRTVQVVIIGLLFAIAPVVVDHWNIFIDRFQSIF